MSALTRRSLVASTAAIPVAAMLALPAVAAQGAEPDPIFTAIERHRKADRAFFARCKYEDHLAGAGQTLAPAHGDDRTPEMVAVVEAAVATRKDLANTSPTTIAGLLAYLCYVREQGDALGEFLFDGEEECSSFAEALGRSARLLARVS